MLAGRVKRGSPFGIGLSARRQFGALRPEWWPGAGRRAAGAMIWKRKSRGDLATPWAARRSEFLLGVERFGLKAGWAVVVQAATSERRMSPLLSRLTMLARVQSEQAADLVHLA